MRSRQSLVKEADRVFSIHIRNRGANYGYNHCYTCSAYMPVEGLQCGHFRPRRYLNTRWHPFNCWPQCNDCNVEKHGNLTKYKNKLVAQYGQDAVDAIYELSTGSEKITEEYIRNIIKTYKST
jgi:hypothetical protein